jgi:pimeloyl-ACP methyl ester carboxylesterase
MIEHSGESRFYRRGNVRLHYTISGQGPTLVLIHGLPDFCNGWRYQIAHLRPKFRVAAIDMRGVNLSDKPAQPSAYQLGEVVRDIVSLLDELELERATLIGHDWGGMAAWWTAMLVPSRVERLAVLAAPHPACYLGAVEQGRVQYPPEYASQLQNAAPGDPFDPAQMSQWVRDPIARAELTDALRRSNVEGLRNFYRANSSVRSNQLAKLPSVELPVLAMYGIEDPLIASDVYEQSASHVSGDFQIVAVPGAGHFLHQEAADTVNFELLRWLTST